MMPKSDSQIQKDVLAELEYEPSVRASNIGVEVNDGIVTLAGHVDSYAEKWHAEKAAQRVKGVKGVAVEMDVKLPGNNKRTDADIARAVKNTLESTYFRACGTVVKIFRITTWAKDQQVLTSMWLAKMSLSRRAR